MKTKILGSDEIQAAVEWLKRGELVIFPTETVYGLGASAYDENGIRQIFEIKKRPADNPVIAHVSSIEQAEALAESLPSEFYALAKAFWPGPLALIVRRSEKVPAAISAGHPTIAIRMPSHPLALALIKLFGTPLAAPSANLSGRPSPTTVYDALEDLDGKIPVAIDGGECRVGIESTVLSLVHSTPTILRPGEITREQIEETIGQSIAVAGHEEKPLSPGMKYRHYAPKAKVKLVYRLNDLKGPLLTVTSQTLYSELRKADRRELSEIEIYCDERTQRNPALMNRLLRASGEVYG